MGQEEGSFKEWLVTNNAGSFAFGTANRLPERKYHGLLNVRSPLFLDPHQILQELNEVLLMDGKGAELGNFHYGELIHPKGYQHLESFSPGEAPCWHYRIGKMHLRRTLRLHPTHPMVLLRYEITNAPSNTSMLLYPYFNCRRIHDLAQENAVLDGRLRSKSNPIKFQFYKDFPGVFLDCERGEFELSGFWNQRVGYPEEARRGYDAAEDLFCPGSFRIAIDQNLSFSLVVGLDEPGEGSPTWPASSTNKQTPSKEVKDQLKVASQRFLIELPNQKVSVIAGFPWFGEWGRDTFIALPGLTMAVERKAVATQVFQTYAAQLKNGLVPNVLGRTPEESDGYSVDASLWFIRALQLYQFKWGREAAKPFVSTVFEILETMLHRKVRGIHVRPSGLLYASSHPRPLTWMDACVDGLPVTGRSPFAVDINALFYNAIRFALEWAEILQKKAFQTIWQPIGENLKETFVEAFWLEEEEYLADAHDGVAKDVSFRPNQLLALSLPSPLLDKKRGRKLLDKVRKQLLTPFGLRTLAPNDPTYQGTCQGTQPERDLAYHQGTVWPWLLGSYWDAVRYVSGPSVATKEAKTILQAFGPHLNEGCVGQVAEIFDGDAPHHPRGAPAQAWSVAELLRIAYGFSDIAPKASVKRPKSKS